MENIEELKSLFKAFDMIQTLVPEDGKCLEKNGTVINVTKDGNTLKITIISYINIYEIWYGNFYYVFKIQMLFLY